ncbi:MAG: penicillin-binding transpeptidase domain-containing protein [Actinobacteria bacterium]|nr:penicillin-binding transpeptidase domain-containing protein [Actinomycetota bacterium]
MKFAVRLSILGIVFVAMFSVVGLRLWFVQVAEGPAIALATEEQTWIQQTSYAPRGDIRDRNGVLLATSRMVPAVVIDRTFVQPEEREELIRRLSALLAIDADELDAVYEKEGINARFQVAIVSNELAYQLNEQLDVLPGVEIAKVPERVYLSGPTLAHVIGHLGLPDEADVEENPDIDLNLRIGRLGVESAYDQFLQGTSGILEYRVRRGEIIDQKPPVAPLPGNSLELTIDLELQQLVELALEEGIALSNAVKDADQLAGEDVFGVTEKAAAVVLDAKTFEILALASVPDFDPQLFVAGIHVDTYADLNEREALFNRAIGGRYPPASTFKAITYAVIEEENLPFPDRDDVDVSDRLVNCDGKFILPDLTDGSQQVKRDWYDGITSFGWLDIHGALVNSCNKFFWAAGLGTYLAWDGTPRETVIQDWAGDLGYGSATGIDLEGEIDGTIPSRAEFERRAKIQEDNPDAGLLHPSRLEDDGAIWQGGDLMDFAIGQGAFEATPLQVAVSYAVLANGGRVMEPRVVSRVIDSSGNTVQEISSPRVRTVAITSTTRESLLADLGRVVSSGTARAAFKDFGDGLDQIGGKTGTAEISANKDSHAWFVGVAPLNSPQYIVVVLVEEGGSGGRIAAPVARHILQYLMGNVPTPIEAGEKTD